MNEATTKGMKFQGNTGDAISKELGQTLEVKGEGTLTGNTAANNIRTKNNGGVLEIGLAESLTGINSIAGKGGTTPLTISNGGTTLTINAGEGTKPGTISVGSAKITNVAEGTDGTDAVNVSQLNAVAAKELHIKPTTDTTKYTVDTNGDVTLTYVNGNGEAVADTKAVISGVAKQDLSNITNAGRKVITGLGPTINAGDGITITAGTPDADTGKQSFTIAANKQVESVTKADAAEGDENIATVTMMDNTIDKTANARYGVGVSKKAVANIAKDAVEVTKGSDNVTVDKDTSTTGKTIYKVSVAKTQLAAGTNTTVEGKGTEAEPYKVNVKGDLGNITSITNEAGSGKVIFDNNGVVKVDGDHPVSIDGKQGYIGGLQNTTWNVANPTYVSGRAATEDQLKAVNDEVNKKADKTALWDLAVNNGTSTDKVEPKATNVAGENNRITIQGSGAVKVTQNDGVITIGAEKGADNDTITTVTSTDKTVDVTKVGTDDHAYNLAVNKQAVVDGAQLPVVYTTKTGEKVTIDKDGKFHKADGTEVQPNDVETRIQSAAKNTTAGDTILNNVGSAIATTEVPEGTGNKQNPTFLERLEEAAKAGKHPNAAVNVSDLKNTADAVTAKVTDTGMKYGANLSAKEGGDKVVTNKLGSTVNIVGTADVTNATEADKQYDGNNVITSIAQDTDGNTTVTVKLNKDLKSKSLTTNTVTVKGEDGKDGQPGKDAVVTVGEKGEKGAEGKQGKPGSNGTIGVNGKDGSAVVINGKDGSIGMNGKDGANGLTMKGDKGAVGVDGTDGANGKDGMTRIVYETKHPDPNNAGKEITVKHEVATMDDGLKFTGNNSDTVNKHKLNTLVNIVGEGVTKEAANTFESATGNILVQADGNSTLTVKMNKNLANISSITNGANSGKVEFKDNGVTTFSSGNNGTGGTDKVVTIDGKAGTVNAATSVTAGSVVAGKQTVTPSADGTTPTATDKATDGNYVTGLENKEWNVATPSYVSGRAATEDQLKKISEAITAKSGSDYRLVANPATGTDGKYKADNDGNISLTVQDAANPNNTNTVTITDVAKKSDLDTVKGQVGNTISLGDDTTGTTTAKSLKDGNVKFNIKGDTNYISTAANGDDVTVSLNTKQVAQDQALIYVDNTGKQVFKQPDGTFKDADGNKYEGDVHTKVNMQDPKRVDNVGSAIDTAVVKDATNQPKQDPTYLEKLDVAAKDPVTGKSAVNVSDLKKTADAVTAKVTDTGMKYGANLSAKEGGDKVVTNKLGSTVNIVGTADVTNATEADKQYDGNNVITSIAQDTDGNTTVTVKLNKDLTSKSLTTNTVTVKGEDGKDGQPGKDAVVTVGEKGEPGVAGKDGKPGSNGSIGVNGKDGSAVVINGKDGSIGMNGKDGANGLTMKGDKGAVGLDGTDGANGKDGMTRIVYETKHTDPKTGAETTVKHQVATMDDGQKYSGDNYTAATATEAEANVINKKLNERLEIVGGADKAKLTDNNIGVNAKDGKLKVQLASELTSINSITNGANSGKVEFGSDGVTTFSSGAAAGDKTVTIDGKAGKVTVGNNGKPIAIDGSVGDITGLTNTTLTGPDFGTKGRAATEEQLKLIQGQLGTGNLSFGANLPATAGGKKVVENALGSTVNIIGTANVTADDNYDGNNVVTTVEKGTDGNSTVTIKLNKDLTSKSVTTNTVTVKGEPGANGQDGKDAVVTVGEKGADGKDGSNGTIGVNGKDGSAVVINGKDGSIGLTGPKGENGNSVVINGKDGKIGAKGEDGKSVVINGKDGTIGLTGPKGADGKPGKSLDIGMKEGYNGADGADGVLGVRGEKGVDGKDGITRIVYTTKEIDPATNTEKVVERQVATMDDGLQFTGNNSDTVNKHRLNTLVNIVGEGVAKEQVDGFKSASGNILVAANGTTTLTVKMNKNLANINSITNGANSGKVEFGADGVTTFSGGNNSTGGTDKVVTINGKDGKVTTGESILDTTGLTVKDGAKETKVTNAGTVVKDGANESKVTSAGATFTDSTKTTSVAPTVVRVNGTNGANGTVTDGVVIGKQSVTPAETVPTAGKVIAPEEGNFITGLDNKAWDVTNPTFVSGRAATEDQLKSATTGLVDKGLIFDANTGGAKTNKLGSTVKIQGTAEIPAGATDADKNYDGKNVLTSIEQDPTTGNTTVTVKLNKDLTSKSVTTNTVTVKGEPGANGQDGKDAVVTVGEKGEKGVDGQDGKPGSNGSIGVNGKDGSAVVINGKDGSIGMNGKDGANGLTMKGDKGAVGLDGTDGANGKDGMTRIVYETKHPDPNNAGKEITVKHEVATMDDGQKYSGDNYEAATGTKAEANVIDKKLNERLEIVGGAAKDKLTENNIGVNVDGGKLKVQLASELTSINSITNKEGNGKVAFGENGTTTFSSGAAAGDKTVTIDGKAGKVTVGNNGNPIAIDGSIGDITGLTNTTLDAADFATKGRAATEEQLKVIQGQIGSGKLSFGANLPAKAGGNKVVENALGSTVNIVGTANVTADDNYDGNNVVTTVEKGTDGNSTVTIKLNKDLTSKSLTTNTVTVKGDPGANGQDGKDAVVTVGEKGEPGAEGKQGKPGSDGVIGVNGKDGSAVVINGKDGSIGLTGPKGENGNSVVINGKDGKIGAKGEDGKSVVINGKDGTIGLTGPKGADGKPGKSLDIGMKDGYNGQDGADGVPGVRGEKGVDGKDGITRIVYTTKEIDPVTKTEKVVERQVATMDDGLRFAGNNSDTVNKHRLNTLVNIVGEGVTKEAAKTFASAEGNILVDADGKDALTLRLNKHLNLTNTGSMTVGNSVVNNGGLTVKDGANESKVGSTGAIFTDGTNTTEVAPTVARVNGVKDANGAVTGGVVIGKQSATPSVDGKTPTGTDTAAEGNYITGLENKDWSVKDPKFVSGRAATEDQLKTVSDAAKAVADNTIQFSADNASKTDTQALNKEGGIAFNITGGADKAKLSDNNIGVNANGSTVEVKLAKELKGLTSAEFTNADGKTTKVEGGKVTTGDTVLSTTGLTVGDKDAGTFVTKAGTVVKDGDVTTSTTAGETVYRDGDKATTINTSGITIDNGDKTVSLTNNGLDNGGNKIVNVARGENDTDAVNVAQLNDEVGKAKTTVTVNNNNADANKNLSLTESTAADGHTNYDIRLADKVTLGTDATKQVTMDGTAGTVTAGTGDNIVKVDGTNATVTAGTGTNTVKVDGGKGQVVASGVTVGKQSVTPSADGKTPAATDKATEGNFITGLDNKTWDVTNPNFVSGRAATEDQLKSATTGLVDKGLVFDANTGGAKTNKLGSTVKIQGTAEIPAGATDADKNYDGKNVLTSIEQDANGNTTVTVKLNKDLTSKSVTTNTITVKGEPGANGQDGKDAVVTVGEKGEPGVNGKDGKPGSDGVIGVNGKDGSAVVINGKDGSIGLNGKDGKNGLSIKGDKGVVGVDGTDGANGKDGMTRIVYETKHADPKNPGKDMVVKHEVATMDDGMKYAGDDAQGTDTSKVIAKKLNQTVDIVGGADKEKLTDKNIGVNNVDGKLKVQLASDLTSINSITNKENNGKVEFKDKGVTTFSGGKADDKAVFIDGKQGFVTGLQNKDWNVAKPTVVSGRAATEDQLKVVSDRLAGARKFTGDNKNVTAVVGLGEVLNINGGADATKLTDNNIGVIAKEAEKNADGTVKTPASMTVKLAKNVHMGDGSTDYTGVFKPTFIDKDGKVKPVIDEKTGKPAEFNTTVKHDGSGSEYTVYRPGKDGKPEPAITTNVTPLGVVIESNNTNGKANPPVTLTANGLDNGGNRILNVAPGINGTDGVNVDQLKATANNVLNQATGEAHKAGARAAALAALKPLQYDPLEPTQIMAGIGNYRSETAAAVGLAHYTQEATMLHVGVTLGQHQNMVNAGVTHKFGWSPEEKAIPERYKAGPISSVYVMQDEVSALKQENERTKVAYEQVLADNASMKAENQEMKESYNKMAQDNEEMKAQIKMLMQAMGMK